MRSGASSLGIGFVVGLSAGAGLLLLAFFAATVAPELFIPASPTVTAAITQTTLPTAGPPTSTPTYTPIPSALAPANIPAGYDSVLVSTPDPVGERILDGDLVFAGPLAPPVQAELYRASMKYAQSTIADSKRVAKEINGVGYGDPSNICGPLAIAILRDAGVIASTIVPHDYWLLDPTKVIDQRLIASAFPPERFTHQQFPTPLNKVDWLASPLLPGDFLFIWHGSWGNFDHMLTVSRVDSQGRTYAVTNYGTPEGYMIAETMLYDPLDPKAGTFYAWTKERDQILGSTGFGGFELWRLRPE
jgi:hypothetical protein